MAKQNLLLIDDDPKSRRVMEVSLRNAGFAVTTAADGVEGLTKAQALRPALILSDTGLPGLDGLALCERVKQDEKLKDTPFVFLTDDAAVRTKVRGLELGADDFLTRPIYIQEVITRIHMLLKRRDRDRLAAGEARFYGQLADVSVVDLLQTLEAGGKSGTVTVRGPQVGRIFFTEGRVIDAQAGKRGGAEAVYRMLTWGEGRFEVDFRQPERPHRIETTVQALLLEGMRRVDEW
ncbi:MAG: DUF4388 domain-containing protein, partial [Myxococcales bacterium]|nr:DUF4388 domain-containing protein [Myxococcales bacterium]